MKRLTAIIRKRTSAIGLLLIVLLAGNALQIFAHGGEDHGDEKPKTETTDKGTVSHSSKIGDLEVMFKHPVFAPDTATEGRLFVTKFETNEGFKDVTPAVEAESTNGAVTSAVIEKSETAGVFTVKFPAMPQGTYTIRAKLTHSGETDTATFSGVEIKNQPIASADESGGMSWLRTILIGFIFAVVLGLFGALTFFILRSGAEIKPQREETVSA
jgi:hypothetical protein